MTGAEKILKAEKEIRREGAKAAFLHSAIETTLFFVAVFFAVSALGPEWLPAEVGPVSGEIAASAAVGAVFFFGDAALVYRSRTLEYFEEANPQVKEALRTARDAAEAGEETVMAEALYEDVLEELQSTSSEGFVSTRRIGGSVAVVVVAALLLMSFSYGGYGPGFGIGGENGWTGLDGPEEGDGEAGTDPDDGDGNGDGDGEEEDLDVLGDRDELERGGDEIGLELGSSGIGGGSGEGGGGSGGVSGREYDVDVDVDTDRAEFSPEEDIEDAELVREYNLRIRDQE